MIKTKDQRSKIKPFKIRLKVGDNVIVRSGKYKGRVGKVVQVHPMLNKLTVEGVNLVKKHQKPTRTNPVGGIVELTKPIWANKVAVVDPASKKGSRIGYKFDKDGNKIRVFKSSGKEIHPPKFPKRGDKQ